MLYFSNWENRLNKKDLAELLHFTNSCYTCNDIKRFHDHILSIAQYIHFEYVLFGYTHSSYERRQNAEIVNISNPKQWQKEYQQEHFNYDPVIHEIELQLADNKDIGYFVWDKYDWQLSKGQQRVVDRRRFWGLEYGCSIFANSDHKDFAFNLSLASNKTIPDLRTEAISNLIITPLLLTQKRLSIKELTDDLSEKEKRVAREMMNGKTNWEIACVLDVSENTVKYHIKKIFTKLRVYNRQQAIAVLIAENYLNS